MSFCPPFSQCRAFRIGGKASVSNLTIGQRPISDYSSHIQIELVDEVISLAVLGGLPSTTAPMTWWTLPSSAPVLAHLAPSTGARLLLRGWNARRVAVGREIAGVRKDRARPLKVATRISMTTSRALSTVRKPDLRLEHSEGMYSIQGDEGEVEIEAWSVVG